MRGEGCMRDVWRIKNESDDNRHHRNICQTCCHIFISDPGLIIGLSSLQSCTTFRCLVERSPDLTVSSPVTNHYLQFNEQCYGLE